MSGQREPDAAAFLRAVLAPLPKGEEPVASKTFMRELRAESEEFWRLGFQQIDALEQALGDVQEMYWSCKRQNSESGKAAAEAALRQHRSLVKEEQRIIGALMARPAPSWDAYVWKVRHVGMWDGRFAGSVRTRGGNSEPVKV